MSSDFTLIQNCMKAAEMVSGAADSHLPGKLADIVKTHAGIAVAAAFIPIPGADVAAAGANIWTMYYKINKELGISFKENALKSIATGVATNLGAAAAMVLAVSTALKFIPGLGTFTGGALMAATIYGITVTAGIVYMKVISNLFGKNSNAAVSESDLEEAINEATSDKDAMADMIRESRKGYKK